MNYLIDFAQGTSQEEIDAYLTANNCTITKVFDAFELVFLVSADVEPPKTPIVTSVINDDATTITTLTELVIDNPPVDSFTFALAEEKEWWKAYVLNKIDFTSETATIDRRGVGSTVYVMDSGIDELHSEFQAANITKLFSFTGEFSDTRGHGTAMASLIAGNTCGVTNAKVKVVKILDANQATKQSDLLGALNAILQDHLLSAESSVLNCSWSIPKNEYIESKFRELINQGVYVVTSAGNSGVAIDQVTPASMPEVLVIGSYDQDLKPSNFSNYTATSAISYTAGETNSGAISGWAPGEQIWVALVGGNYGFAAGTSVSAAIHSAVLAYNLSFGQVRLSVDDKQDVKALSRWSLGRENLIDLSDPKYAASANKASTLLNDYKPVSVSNTTINIGVLVGKTWWVNVFDPTTTKSAELIGPTRGDVTIRSDGELVINPTSVNGNYEIYEAVLRLTDMNDVVTDKQLKVAIVDPSFNLQSVGEDDPIVDVNVAIAECCVEIQCQHNGTTCVFPIACYGGAYCYDDSTAKEIICNCV